MLTAVEETRHLQLQLDGVHVPDEKKEDHCLWQKEESPKEEAASPWSTRRTRSSKSPGDVTGGHHLPERAALGSSPPTAPALLLLQVRLQVLFGSHQPALHKREGLIRVLVEEGGVSQVSADQSWLRTCCSPSCRYEQASCVKNLIQVMAARTWSCHSEHVTLPELVLHEQ